MKDKKLWFGLGISLFFMVITFRKIDFHQLMVAFRSINVYYLGLAVVSTFVSYWFRAVRWRVLLMPLKATRPKNLFSATIIGYMANNLLPARLGEFVRAYALARTESLTTSSVFATLVMDRLCDGFTVLLVLVITLLPCTSLQAWKRCNGTWKGADISSS